LDKSSLTSLFPTPGDVAAECRAKEFTKARNVASKRHEILWSQKHAMSERYISFITPALNEASTRDYVNPPDRLTHGDTKEYAMRLESMRMI